MSLIGWHCNQSVIQIQCFCQRSDTADAVCKDPLVNRTHSLTKSFRKFVPRQKTACCIVNLSSWTLKGIMASCDYDLDTSGGLMDVCINCHFLICSIDNTILCWRHLNSFVVVTRYFSPICIISFYGKCSNWQLCKLPL